MYRTHPLPFDDAGNFVRTVDFEEPRWDPQNTNLLWGLREFRIETLDVATGETNAIKDFRYDPRIGPLLRSAPDLYRITTKDEGESSRDKRVWAASPDLAMKLASAAAITATPDTWNLSGRLDIARDSQGAKTGLGES